MAGYTPSAHGVLWVLGTGAQWRELPAKYPLYQTCHRRFQQWVRSGKLETALRLLAQRLRERGEPDLQEAFVDATFAVKFRMSIFYAECH